MRKCLFWLSLCVAAMICVSPVWAVVPDTSAVPPELERWKPWVLFGHEERFCPSRFDDHETPQCRWPSTLSLHLDGSGGSFAQEWTLYVKSWVELPGGAAHWPRDVTVDGQSVPVVFHKESPAVFLEPGKHRIEGAFSWQELPDTLPVPPSSGVVALSVGGKQVTHPSFSQNGRLRLQKEAGELQEADRLDVRVFRLVDDAVPMQITTLLKVTVSGRSREIRMGGVLLEDSIPMRMESPIPTRLDASGDLLLQARPGKFHVTIVSRIDGPVERIGPATAPFGPEIWAFQARTSLRLVQVEGVTPIDPKQTEIPLEWASLSTYTVQRGSVMTLKVLRRGDPDPAPDRLNLKREWWLDFDGRGFTVRDQIDGILSSQWALVMNPPVRLGRVSVDGAEQLITAHGPEKKAGVELRRGEVHLLAESRCEAERGTLPAVGWDHDFQSLSGILNLPPGWRLFSAGGVDVVPGSWFDRWTLLDLFLVFVISLAVTKLWNRRLGFLALGALGLIYHEPDAPQQVWLHLLAAVALLRVLPEGRIRRLVSLYRWGSLVGLVVFAIPFMVQQVRVGIYPQLENVYESPGRGVGSLLGMTPSKELSESLAPAEPFAERAPPRGLSREYGIGKDLKAGGDAVSQQSWLLRDPKAVIQTGPGLPTWSWRQIPLQWNGPVFKQQEMTLWLLSPGMNLVLALLRVVLLGWLIVTLMEWGSLNRLRTAPGRFSAVMLLSLFASAWPAGSAVADWPPPQLLDDLRQRLLKPHECLPRCADIPLMDIHTEGEVFRMTLNIHAAAETAVPLPATAGSWIPVTVLWDDRPAEGLLKDNQGQLWLLALPGVHRAVLTGTAPPVATVDLPLPLRPHRVTVSGSDWEVKGIQPDGRPDASLQLSRRAKGDGGGTAVGEMRLPPFLHVKRVLSLGLSWQVTTTVTRVTPPGTPVSALIPLLATESVTSAGVRTENRQAVVNMEPQTLEVEWTGALEESPEIHLHAPQATEGTSWVETWVLDVSPIWHCTVSGIPVIHHQDAAGFWKPEWRPWPGESLTIAVSRPEAVPGQQVTVEHTALEVTPGDRFRNVKLILNIRTSEGSRFPVGLPPHSTLEQVQIDGKTQPIRQQDQNVIVPLDPGSRSVLLHWREPGGMPFVLHLAGVRIGSDNQQAVNNHVTMNLPRNRWILWAGGPRLGPAVLFWSSLFIVALTALGLGRISWTPLRTYHWLLLGMGLTQVHPVVALVVAGWFLAMGMRARKTVTGGWFAYDSIQLILAVWTLAALASLYAAVHKGLLGLPLMQIAGNHSTDFCLRWTQDRVTETLPQPWVLSVPLMAYRFLMLLWALWLAISLLRWLKWAYQAWSDGEMWRRIPWKRNSRRENAA